MLQSQVVQAVGGRRYWMELFSIATSLVLLSAIHNSASAEDWPQWRGPRRDAVSRETGLQLSWPEAGPPVAWKASGLGTGFSSVVISRGLVFTMGRHDTEVIVTALKEADGQIAWTRKIGTTNRAPCSTPTADGDHLYVLDPDGDLVCLKSASGEIVWERSFLNDFGGKMMSGRGYGESPLIDGEKLICTPGGPEATLVALNKLTGEVLWKAKLPELGAAGREGAGFSSIVPTTVAGVRQYVQLVGRGIVGVAANDGRFLWGNNSIANDTANIPTPVVHGDLVFAANGYNAGSVLVKIVPASQSKEGPQNFDAKVLYSLTSSQFQNHHGGVLLIGDYLYGGHGNNNGLPTCLDFKTGKVLWKRRGPGVGSAAIVSADGHLWFRYQNGLVALIEASPEGYQLKGSFEIPGAGGDSWAHPVIANGRLFLREQDLLWVYEIKGGKGTPTSPVPGTPTAPLEGPLQALRELDVTVETQVNFDKSRRLYRYAIESRRSQAGGDDQPAVPVIVTLTARELSDEGTIRQNILEQLRKVQGPLIVSLAGTAISADGLQQLRAVPRIVGLNLESCRNVTDAGLQRLQACSQLRLLILTGTAVTSAGIEHLKSLSNLVALDLELCDGITDAAGESLGHLPQLQALNLKKTGFEKGMITDKGLHRLQTLKNLEVLNLYGNSVTDAGLVHLQGLPKLKELNLSLLAVTDKGLMHLKSLPALEQLDLLYSVGFSGPTLTNVGMDSLQSLPNLKALNLTGARIDDQGLSRLETLSKLTSLQLVHTQVTPAGIRHFQAAVPGCSVVKEAATSGQ